MTCFEAVRRIQAWYKQYGTVRTIRFVFRRIIRRWPYVLFDACLEASGPAPEWEEGEELTVIGPENVDRYATPDLIQALGPDGMENLNGVRGGNWLLVVSRGKEVLHYHFVMFRNRQTRILGEENWPPLLGCAYTAPAARGRGLFRRCLRAALLLLCERGYRRAIIETHPENHASRKAIEGAGFHLRREGTSWVFMNCLVWRGTMKPPGGHRLLRA
jgi:GNAT superfamily N-acetyltransferase